MDLMDPVARSNEGVSSVFETCGNDGGLPAYSLDSPKSVMYDSPMVGGYSRLPSFQEGMDDKPSMRRSRSILDNSDFLFSLYECVDGVTSRKQYEDPFTDFVALY